MSRPSFEVATWSGLSGVATSIVCRDMILAALLRFAVATWALGRDKGRRSRSSCARDQTRMRAQHACYAHSSAHDLGTARAVYARPGPWVCALCTQPSFVTVHCLGSLFGHCS